MTHRKHQHPSHPQVHFPEGLRNAAAPVFAPLYRGCSRLLLRGLGLAFLLGISGTLFAQETDSLRVDKYYFAIYVGTGIGGPNRDIKENMERSGLGDQRPAGFFGGGGTGKNNPRTRTYPTYGARVGYHFKRKSGVFLDFRLALNSQVDGYDNGAGLGRYFNLDSDLLALSLQYGWLLGQERFFVGPTYYAYSVRLANNLGPEDRETAGLFGVTGGLQLLLHDRPNWYLAISPFVHLPIGRATIGPYTRGDNSQQGPESTFQAVELDSFATFSISIAVGLKYRRNSSAN